MKAKAVLFLSMLFVAISSFSQKKLTIRNKEDFICPKEERQYWLDLNAQEEKSDYFTIEGQKFIKPKKYILFNPEKDSMKEVDNNKFFYLGNERFQFVSIRHKVDTCSVTCFDKLQFIEADKLSSDEQLYIENIVKELDVWDIRAIYLDPQIELHPYYKVYIVVPSPESNLIYEVDWDYTGIRGLHSKPSAM